MKSKKACGRHTVAYSLFNPLLNPKKILKTCVCGKKTSVSVLNKTLVPIIFESSNGAKKWMTEVNEFNNILPMQKVNPNYNYVWRCVQSPNARITAKKGCLKYQYAKSEENPLLKTERTVKKCWYCSKRTVMNMKSGSLIPMLFDSRHHAKKWVNTMNSLEEVEEPIVTNETMDIHTAKIYSAFARANKNKDGWVLKRNIRDLAFVYENMAHASFYRHWKKISDDFDVMKDGRNVHIRMKRINTDVMVLEKDNEHISKEVLKMIKKLNNAKNDNYVLRKQITELKETIDKLNIDLLDKEATKEQWTPLVTQTVAENQMLRLRINEYEALLKHYEQTMAVLLERMITERGVLNTPVTTENRAESGGIVERATQNEVNK